MRTQAIVMGILNTLQRIITTVTQEISKPKSHVDGEAFEKYLQTYTFPKSHYQLIYRTSSYNDNKENYALASKLPDFKFACKATGEMFYVEAKFRSGNYWENDKLKWTYPAQLDRYKQVDARDAPVFNRAWTRWKPQ